MKRACFCAMFAVAVLCMAAADDGDSKTLPSGYGGVTLGMSMDEAKDALKKHGEFGYHGDRDVSLLPGENRALIETSAKRGHVKSFLTNCYFQFYDDSLYIITINLNREKVDHYSVFKTLCGKYGKPYSLDPEKSTWKSDGVTMCLERPLALKYIDNAVFDDLNKKSSTEPTGSEITQDKFLEGL